MDQVPLIVSRLVGLLLLCFLVQTGFAQSRRDSVHVTLHPVPSDRTSPEYPGGTSAMVAYLRQHVHYPKAAEQGNVKGFVMVSYVLDSTGILTNVRVIQGLGYGCDEEALRVVRAMPRWTPGTQSGRRVAVPYGLPIHFPYP